MNGWMRLTIGEPPHTQGLSHGCKMLWTDHLFIHITLQVVHYFLDILQTTVSGIKELSLSHTVHEWIQNQVCTTSKFLLISLQTVPLPVPLHTTTRVLCVGPHRVILICLLPDRPSKMKTFQKPVVSLTLHTPTVARMFSFMVLKACPKVIHWSPASIAIFT